MRNPTASDPASQAGTYDANYYQQWAATDPNWQYWAQANAGGAQAAQAAQATPNANYYGYTPNYGFTNTATTPATGDANAYQYGMAYPGYTYDYTQAAGQNQYNYAAAAQYAQQYGQQYPPPPPPTQPQPPPPSTPYGKPAPPTAKPGAPSWASVVKSEAPAYTSVNFKINKPAPLQRTGMPTQPLQHIIQQQKQTKPEPQNPAQWPPKLKAFVERTFEKCEDSEKATIEAELKQVITKAIQENTLWAIDWDSEVLPSRKLQAQVEKKPKKNKRKSEFTIAPEDEEKKQRRQKRFLSTGTSRSSVIAAPMDAMSELDWDQMTVKGYLGTVDDMRYLRLTSAPDPATVRPETVLKKTIKMLREKWQQNEDYDYICEQLKSVRQDLTVQRIKNAFTVGVYEMHARLALENDDLGEFNQCQTQLKELYREGLANMHVAEFTGYRILYYLHVQGDVANVLRDIPSALRNEPAVAHSMQVMTAVALNNYHKFFKLYPETPNMGQYIMDKLVKRVRLNAIKAIVKSYRPSVPLLYVQKELGFTKEAECRTYLKEVGAVVTNTKEGPEIDAKNSMACMDVTS